jgi:hypothetical protein
MKERDDGKVRDIAERLQKGEINHKEAYKLLIETGLTEEGASIGLLVLFIAGCRCENYREKNPHLNLQN